MLENALKQRNITRARAVGVKSAVSAALIAASVLLPQLVHALYGAAGGAKFLPMYIPVLLGGVLLGRVWGVCVAVASPVVSYLVTLSLGNPMPAAARLPYMIVELRVQDAREVGHDFRRDIRRSPQGIPSVRVGGCLRQGGICPDEHQKPFRGSCRCPRRNSGACHTRRSRTACCRYHRQSHKARGGE